MVATCAGAGSRDRGGGSMEYPTRLLCLEKMRMERSGIMTALEDVWAGFIMTTRFVLFVLGDICTKMERNWDIGLTKA